MDQPDELRKLAQDKIVAESGAALDRVGVAAAGLLADLYATGLAHGITPQDWAAVTALPRACWDASRAAGRRQLMAAERARTMSGRTPFAPVSPVGTPHDAVDGLRMQPRVVAAPVGPARPGPGLSR